jgi:hypothetical protein
MRNQGRYGAVNTKSPRKLNLVSGFLRDQMYTKVEDRGCPRKGMETRGDNKRRLDMAYMSSQEKWAGDRPDDSSISRAYR